VLGRLAADEGTPGVEAAGGDPGHELRDLVRVEDADRNVVEKNSGSAPLHATSSAHIATRSRPIVSYRPSAPAIAVFVPTPSVEETSTGDR